MDREPEQAKGEMLMGEKPRMCINKKTLPGPRHFGLQPRGIQIILCRLDFWIHRT